jgi:competence protein ComEC
MFFHKDRLVEKFSTSIFLEKRDFFLFLLSVFSIFSISTTFTYLDYLKFSKFKNDEKILFVENFYQKGKFSIMKLRSEDGFSFYTSSRNRYRDLSGYTIKAKVHIGELTFLQYLSGAFLYTSEIRFTEKRKDYRYILKDKIFEMHSDKKIGELYSALFLATPISKDLREDLTRFGINHLAVLSGFHASLLIGLVYFLVLILYKRVHQKYFPYRNRNRDILIFSIFIISIYAIFIGSPAPFIRSIGMVTLGFFLFDRNIFKGFFETLFLISTIMIAFYPNLLFSVGFLFSVSGVFYILLYLKYFNFSNFWNMIFINFWVFLAMLPIIHLFFPDFYFSQLLSPFLTILFSIFYPLSLLAHFVGFADIFDEVLLNLFAIRIGEVFQFSVEIEIFLIYIALSLYFAIFFKRL